MLLSMQQSKINLQEARWNWSKGSGIGEWGQAAKPTFLMNKGYKKLKLTIVTIISNLGHKL